MSGLLMATGLDQFPLDGASNITKQDNLKWKVEEGVIDSFDVFFGADPDSLTKIASGITDTSFPMPTLNPQTTYYWQVVGHAKNKLIYGDIWSFSTKEIIQPLSVEIKATPNIGIAPLKVQFDAIVNGGDPANYIYLWDINNDGKMDYTTKNPVHSYTSAGTHTAVLTVFDGVDTVVKNIAVTVLNPLTVEVKAEPKIGFTPLKVQFDALVTGGYPANYTYSWDVNNDGIIDHTIKNPVDTYTVTGTFIAVLKVSDGFDTVTKNITIHTQEPPKALTSVVTAEPTSGKMPLVVQFDATANGGTDNYIYTWNLTGDGITYVYGKNQTYIYTKAGIYTVTSQVWDGVETIKNTVTITVNDPLSTMIMAEPMSGTAPLTVKFSSKAVGGKSGSYMYDWDVTGDGIQDFSIANPTFTYTQSGSYNVTLKVTDGAEVITKTLTIKVEEPPPSPPLTAKIMVSPVSGVAPLKVKFFSRVNGGKGNNYTYEWDLNGDSIIDSTTYNPVFVYTSAGTYNVVFKATDGVETVTKNLTITVLPPMKITAMASPVSGVPPLEVRFDITVKNAKSEKITYEWDINGDGIIDYFTKSFIYIYTSPGTYAATVKVTSGKETASAKLKIAVGK